jgi:molybdopterin adenylyltransferase
MIKVGIITASDKGSQGDRKDLSAPVIEELVKSIGGEVAAYAVVPDEQALLEEKLKEYADEKDIKARILPGNRI